MIYLDIETSNKLMAEFLGVQPENNGEYEMYGAIDSISGAPSSKHFYHPEQMKFSKSWNWLMEVIKKINETGISGGVLYDLRSALMTGDIEKAYNEAGEFINWYNENN